MKIKIAETDKMKVVSSLSYSYIFNKETGFFARWGTTKEEDPVMAPCGPEILDMEISTICNLKCPACYKSNTNVGTNMSLETVKTILSKFNKTLCQVAYGIGSVKSNGELFSILEYTRSQGIIPNITVNGHDISDEEITKLANVCGAVSVSFYNEADCFGTVERLVKAKSNKNATLRQVNIHALLSLEGLDKCYSVIKAAKEDSRLVGLGAIVLMTLKPRGIRNILTPLNSLEKFQALFKFAIDGGVSIGMDSCAAPNCFRAIEKLGMMNIAPSVEGCESSIFSSYINVLGDFFPCSFSEGQGEWSEGISVINSSDFVKDVWFNPKLTKWREKLLSGSKKCNGCFFQKTCRPCPLFDITPCNH